MGIIEIGQDFHIPRRDLSRPFRNQVAESGRKIGTFFFILKIV